MGKSVKRKLRYYETITYVKNIYIFIEVKVFINTPNQNTLISKKLWDQVC